MQLLLKLCLSTRAVGLSLASEVFPALQGGSDRQQLVRLRQCVSILDDK